MATYSINEQEKESKESLYDTLLKTLSIKQRDLYNLYPQIGCGDEGSVHQYNDSIAIKIFSFFEERNKLPNKYKKIESFAAFKDESFCFPLGLVGFEDEQKEGYFTDLVLTDEKIKTFDDLKYFKDVKKLLEYLIKADTAIERIHKKGFIIGDVKGNNIMIDINGNPRFVDVDNYVFEDFEFDIYPVRRDWFKSVFKKDCSSIDSDIYIYAMLCLQFFANGTLLRLARSPYYFKTMIELIDIDSESKDILRAIFSDAENKPYIGQVLRKISPDQKLFQSHDIQTLNRIF